MTDTKWRVWAFGAALVVGLVAPTGCRSASGDLRGAGEAEGLSRTAETARTTLAEHRGAAETGVERFVALFSDFRPEPVAAAGPELYARNAYFNDGFAELEGAESVTEYLARTAEDVVSFDIDIHDVVYGERDAYIRWTMRFTTTGSKTVIAPGVSQLRFDADGRIILHRDHWDASGALATFVPVVPTVLQSIRDRVH